MFDVLIRLSNAERVCPGGFADHRKNLSDMLGLGIWHNDHLLPEGAISGADIEQVIKGGKDWDYTPLGWRRVDRSNG
jgi:hypothetical protein